MLNILADMHVGPIVEWLKKESKQIQRLMVVGNRVEARPPEIYGRNFLNSTTVIFTRWLKGHRNRIV